MRVTQRTKDNVHVLLLGDIGLLARNEELLSISLDQYVKLGLTLVIPCVLYVPNQTLHHFISLRMLVVAKAVKLM